jgi:hypothetical protein
LHQLKGFANIVNSLPTTPQHTYKEIAVVDYFPLRSNSHTLPDTEHEEAQEAQQPVVVDFVFNTHEERNGKTIALKISFRLPMKS